jgi:hypothetical protein
MKYCPHCLKPSARQRGPCPHCGGDLGETGGGLSEDRNTSTRPATPVPGSEGKEGVLSPRQTGHPAQVLDETPQLDGLDLTAHVDSGVDIPAGRGALTEDMAPLDSVDREREMSGLELASLAPVPDRGATRLGAKKTVDVVAAREVAGFGVPGSGPMGAIKYWIHVRNRLKALSDEHRLASGESQNALEKKLGVLADMGRRSHSIGFVNDSVKPLVEKARIAEGKKKGADRVLDQLEHEHAREQEKLTQLLEKAELDAKPFRIQEEKALEQKKELMTRVGRIEAKQKRANIEIRNLDELIGKRQANYTEADPLDGERDRLFQEISSFESKRLAIVDGLKGSEKELAVMVAPLAEKEDHLASIRASLNEKLVGIKKLERSLDELNNSHRQKTEEQNSIVASGTQNAEDAWAAVGERILLEPCDDPELKESKRQALRSMEGAAASANRVEVLESAMESYDRDVVDRAKRLVTIAAALVVLVLGLLIVIASLD